MEQYFNKSLSRFLSSDIIKKIYPMVTEIEAYNFYDDNSLLVFKIFIDDSKITKDNMYSRGLDPHYLIDFHIREILPYFSIPRTASLGFILIGPNGEVIHSFLGL